MDYQQNGNYTNAITDRRSLLTSIAAFGTLVSLSPLERALAANIPPNAKEIGTTSKGTPVVLTDTDKFYYPEMASGWQSRKNPNNTIRQFPHPGIDWNAQYGREELAGLTGTIEKLIPTGGEWATAIAIRSEKKLPNGNYIFLVKYHLTLDTSLKERQKIEYHQQIGTKDNQGSYVGTHTHEHVLLGRRIYTVKIPHRQHRNLKVDRIHTEQSQSPADIRSHVDHIRNPLDYYADANPSTPGIIEIAAISGPQEADKFREVAKSRIVLGTYALPKAERQAVAK